MLTFNQVLELAPVKRKDVIRQAATILQRDPNNTNALILGGAAYMGERDANNARQLLEKARSLDKKNPQILIYLTRFYQETNDHKKAKDAARKLCELDKSIPQYRMIYG